MWVSTGKAGTPKAWDITTDGRFVATSPHAESGEPIELILNWTTELDQ